MAQPNNRALQNQATSELKMPPGNKESGTYTLQQTMHLFVKFKMLKLFVKIFEHVEMFKKSITSRENGLADLTIKL